MSFPPCKVSTDFIGHAALNPDQRAEHCRKRTGIIGQFPIDIEDACYCLLHSDIRITELFIRTHIHAIYEHDFRSDAIGGNGINVTRNRHGGISKAQRELIVVSFSLINSLYLSYILSSDYVLTLYCLSCSFF